MKCPVFFKVLTGNRTLRHRGKRLALLSLMNKNGKTFTEFISII